MPIWLALVLVGLGSASLLVLRERRLVLAGLGVQWAGLVATFMAVGAGPGGVAVEAVTAVVCLAVLGLTLRGVRDVRVSQMAGVPDAAKRVLQREEEAAARMPGQFSREGLGEGAWLWAVALVVGVAGYGLARVYPLGASEGAILAFYWAVLSAAMALVVHGTRNGVVMAAGLLSLFNGVGLALELVGAAAPGPVALALVCAGRIGLCVLLAYVWMLLKVTFMSPGLDLGPLFDGRDGRWPTETALAVVGPQPASRDGATEEASETEAAELAGVSGKEPATGG